MLITASECPQGYKIIEYKDVVFGVCNSTVGGDFRHQTALKRMSECAKKLGANTIVNFRIKIYKTTDDVMEAAAYGNAVIADPIDGIVKHEAKQNKINYEAYKKKVKVSPDGEVHDINGYKFVICPQCGTKYRVESDEKGIRIKGFEDVDLEEPGLQIFCLRCGTKFTVPED